MPYIMEKIQMIREKCQHLSVNDFSEKTKSLQISYTSLDHRNTKDSLTMKFTNEKSMKQLKKSVKMDTIAMKFIQIVKIQY